MEVSSYHLTDQLKRNDEEAYKFIFRAYYMELYYMALEYTHNSEEAKDITQLTYIKFWENRSRLLENKPIQPLLFIIHKNNCLDHLKFKGTHKQYLINDNINETDSDTPLDQIVSKELEFNIIKAISELPPRCRQIFELSRFKGLKYAEIAEKLKLSVKTVENQMGIALDKLRTSLIDYLPFLLLLALN